MTALEIERELLRRWAATVDELREVGVLRSGNNPVGDYAELLVVRHSRGTRAPVGYPGYDVLADGERIQVKAIRESLSYRRTTLSTIHGVEGRGFDSIYAVRFAHDLSAWRAWRIPREQVAALGKKVGPDVYRLELTDRVVSEDITEVALGQSALIDGETMTATRTSSR